MFFFGTLCNLSCAPIYEWKLHKCAHLRWIVVVLADIKVEV